MVTDANPSSTHHHQLAATKDSLIELTRWLKLFCTEDVQEAIKKDEDRFIKEVQTLKAALRKADLAMSHIIENK